MVLMVPCSLAPKWPILVHFCGMDHQKPKFLLILEPFLSEAVEDSQCYFFENWFMKLKFPNLLKPLGTKILQYNWSFYPSELIYFTLFTMRHPVNRGLSHLYQCIKNQSNFDWFFQTRKVMTEGLPVSETLNIFFCSYMYVWRKTSVLNGLLILFSGIDLGQVTDGTKCGNQKMCMNRTCIDMQQYATYTRCPVDANNVECSGQGICSNINTCVCDLGLGGNDCSKKVPTITPFIDPNQPQKVTTPTPDASQTDSNTYIRKWLFY